MTRHCLRVQPTRYGYILFNNDCKFVLTTPKKLVSGVRYCLKEVQPVSMYITGLFYDSRHKLFKGRSPEGKTVLLKLGLEYAELFFN